MTLFKVEELRPGAESAAFLHSTAWRETATMNSSLCKSKWEMTFSFCRPFSQAAQRLQLSPGWRCSYISSTSWRTAPIPRIAATHPPTKNKGGYYLAICRLHVNAAPNDAQPKTGDKTQKRKRKGKNSLRRVAVEAQRSQETDRVENAVVAETQPITKVKA